MTVRGPLGPTAVRAQARACIFLLLLLPLAAMADYQSGLDAYNQGDFTTALHDWKAAITTLPAAIDAIEDTHIPAIEDTHNPPAAIDAIEDTHIPANSPAISPAAQLAINAETHYAIGMLYWTGQGVTRDYFAASNWMHQAARLNHAGAQAKLGYLYSEGIAVARDYKRAFQWFSKAAKQGDIDGQYNLGIFYLNGWGTEADITMAAQYLAAASAQGDEGAEQMLQSLLPLPRQQQPASAPPQQTTAAPSTAATPRHSGIAQQLPQPSQERPGTTGGNETAWILAQNPNHYTIQVIALRSLAKLQSLIEGYDYLAPFATYTVELKGKPLHVLVQGDYAQVESARQARDNFPRAINRPSRVWIRQFSKIQEIINQAGQGAHE